jgi:hypothetical protein
MEASFRCWQGLGCVLCSEPHESRQIQIILNFYSPCKYYPKSRTLISTVSSFQALQPQLHVSLNSSVSSLQVLQPRVYVFNPSSFSLQVLQSKLYVSQLISLLYSSAPSFTSLSSSLSSLQVFQLQLYVYPLFFLLLLFRWLWYQDIYSDLEIHVAHVQQMLRIRPPSNYHYSKYLSESSNKACILEVKKSMSHVCNQEVTAWFNVGIFYKSLASQLLLKGSKSV